MTSTILRSTVAALAFAGALAFATPVHSRDDDVQGQPERQERSARRMPPAAPATVTATYDTDSKKLTWKGTLFRPHRPGHRRPFPWAGSRRQECRRDGADQRRHQPARRLGHAQRRPGQGPDGRRHVRQRPHRSQQGRRNSRPVDEIDVRRILALTHSPPVATGGLFLSPTRRCASWRGMPPF